MRYDTKIKIELNWGDFVVLHEMASERLEHMMKRKQLPFHLMFYERIDAFEALHAAMLAHEDPGEHVSFRGNYAMVMRCRKARHHILFLPEGKRAPCCADPKDAKWRASDAMEKTR